MSLIVFAFDSPASIFEPDFAQRALLATLCVAVIGGALGATILLRDLPFFAHAIGTGAYPALVLGVAWGVSLALAAPIGALVFAVCLWLGTRQRRQRGAPGRDAQTGILVARALAVGAIATAILGSTETQLSLPPETLLFGSVLTVGPTALVTAAIAAVGALVASFLFGARWLAAGFDAGVAKQLGAGKLDLVLLMVVALAVAATLPVTGSLMAGALLVIPAATARMFTGRVVSLSLATLAISIFDGVVGIYLALAFDLPAGATIAVTAGTVFVAVAIGAVVVRSITSTAGRPARPAAAAMLATALLIAGCGTDDSAPSPASGELRVVATSTQVADIVRQVGGGAVDVSSLLKPGSDPHSYDPAPSDVANLADARVIFRSGGDIDQWLAPAIKAAGADRPPVDLSQAAVLISGSHEHSHEDGDQNNTESESENINAHWYLSPDNLKLAAQRVRDELIKANPTARETYRASADNYIQQIDEIDRALAKCSGNVPAADRVVASDHNDFEYLTAHYRIKLAALLRENGETEPSVRDLQDATEAARKAKARALLTSKGEGGRLAKQVARRLDVPLLELYGDSLKAEGQASTALGAISENARAIFEAVGDGAASCPDPRP
ncbi:MAG: zinc ABC transporter substrate-binding protein [Solirubrobacterales bacterium]